MSNHIDSSRAARILFRLENEMGPERFRSAGIHACSCPDCDADGWIDDRECVMCEGSGEAVMDRDGTLYYAATEVGAPLPHPDRLWKAGEA